MWNYRVARRTLNDKGEPYAEPFLAFYEVYYAEDNEKIEGISTTPRPPIGDTPEELAEVLEMMKRALEKPVLEWEEVAKST